MPEITITHLDPDTTHLYNFIKRCNNVIDDDTTLSGSANFVNNLILSGNLDSLGHACIILKIDEDALRNIRNALNAEADAGDTKFPIVRNDFKISNLHGFGYMTGSLKAFLFLQKNETLMANDYISCLFNALSNEFPELFTRTNSKIIPTIHILSRKKFINDIEMNYGPDRIRTLIGKHLTQTFHIICSDSEKDSALLLDCAKYVLTMIDKTNIIVTASETEWQNILCKYNINPIIDILRTHAQKYFITKI